MAPVTFILEAALSRALCPQLKLVMIMPIHHWLLWTFCFTNVAQLTGSEGDLGLRLVEAVKCVVQSILQGCNVSVRMERLPWLNAALGLAGLSHHHQGV